LIRPVIIGRLLPKTSERFSKPKDKQMARKRKARKVVKKSKNRRMQKWSIASTAKSYLTKSLLISIYRLASRRKKQKRKMQLRRRNDLIMNRKEKSIHMLFV
jgi:hypothetical protein